MEATIDGNPVRDLCMHLDLGLNRQDGYAHDASPHRGRDEACGNPAYCEMRL